MSTVEKARLLISETRAALANGCRHWDKDGKPLNTVLDVLRALARDKYVTVEFPRSTSTRQVWRP